MSSLCNTASWSPQIRTAACQWRCGTGTGPPGMTSWGHYPSVYLSSWSLRFVAGKVHVQVSSPNPSSMNHWRSETLLYPLWLNTDNFSLVTLELESHPSWWFNQTHWFYCIFYICRRINMSEVKKDEWRFRATALPLFLPPHLISLPLSSSGISCCARKKASTTTFPSQRRMMGMKNWDGNLRWVKIKAACKQASEHMRDEVGISQLSRLDFAVIQLIQQVMLPWRFILCR